MNTTEHRIYHVARKCAGHNFELDDRLYGSPLPMHMSFISLMYVSLNMPKNSAVSFVRKWRNRYI